MMVTIPTYQCIESVGSQGVGDGHVAVSLATIMLDHMFGRDVPTAAKVIPITAGVTPIK